MNGGRGISYEIDLRWMPLDLTDDKSTLVQVMAWCRQAPSHYLSQCWPRSMSPYGVIRPQWVNHILMIHSDLMLMLQDISVDRSTLVQTNIILVQIMARCRQTTCYLLPAEMQIPSSVIPLGITIDLCVNSLWPGDAIWRRGTGTT